MMGWLGVKVEVGTILTASAALGIAVDDSLHFITWFRRKINDGGTIAESVQTCLPTLCRCHGTDHVDMWAWFGRVCV